MCAQQELNMLDFLKKLTGGGERAPEPADPVDHAGFQIVAMPRAVPGGWSTEGIIRGSVDGQMREVPFIRADTCMNRDDAIRASQAKARKIIDERGDKLFDGRRA
jgi:hypothetical protein